MRVELLYSPGCSSFAKAQNYLETIIAEEGLPVPIELIEEPGHSKGNPSVRIENNIVLLAPFQAQIDFLRDVLCAQWKDLTEKPLIGSA